MKDTVIKPPTIRQAKAADVPCLEEIIRYAYRGGKKTASWTNEYNLVKGPRISYEQLNEILSRDDQELLVAEVDVDNQLRMAGCIRVDKISNEFVYFALFAVDPDWQSAGVGKYLFKAAEDYARDIFKCQRIKMSVLSTREDLIAWYKRMGFDETDETEPFLGPESGVTALVENLYFRVFTKSLN